MNQHQPLLTDRPSAEAYAVAHMLALLKPQEAVDLFRMVEQERACPTPAERRYRRLGLIMRLIAERSGELPGPTTYDQAQAAANAAGADWPNRSTLEQHYGTYNKAREAAVRFLAGGTASRVPASYQHATRRPGNGTYKLKDGDPKDREVKASVIADALIAFREREHDWPVHPYEFDYWASLRRGEARAKGQPPPEYPGSLEIRRIFPQFGDALDFAMIRLEGTAAA